MKTLVITGASGGIGLATARRFLKDSYRVINFSRRPCPLKEVVHFEMDLQKVCPDKLEMCRSHLEKADEIVLVHNASLLYKDTVDGVDENQLHHVFAVNVAAPCLLNKWILKWMDECQKRKKDSKCSILYVGSTLSEKAVSRAFSYVTTKHAQAGMMKATCQDLMGRGIHTALICPGFTDTEMLREHVGGDETTLQALGESNSYGRLIQPEEIGRYDLFRGQSFRSQRFCCPRPSRPKGNIKNDGELCTRSICTQSHRPPPHWGAPNGGLQFSLCPGQRGKFYFEN